MHTSSMDLMAEFARKYIGHMPMRVLDVGSCDICGSYRDIFRDHRYIGLDLEPGKNVDMIGGLYRYPAPDNSFDVVISGQTIEHVRDLHRWITELARVLAPCGLCCVIGPNTFPEHRHPVDCWRIFPDGMRFLLEEVAGLTVLECRSEGIDTIGVARKPLP